MTINCLIVPWRQNNQGINGLFGVGTEEVFFLYIYISHYSFLAAKSTSDSAVSHIRLRDTTNPISYFILSQF